MSQDDRRNEGPQFPVARYEFARVSWATNDGHAAQTTVLNVNGTIYRMDVLISSVTANPTVNITFTDQNDVSLADLNQSSLADGTNHTFNSESNKATQDADFDPVIHNGQITASVDPSADPGGDSQTLTVDIILYVR